MSLNSEIAQSLELLISTLKDMGIGYYVGGSVASSTHGLPRTTLDVDMVIKLARTQVTSLVKRLEQDYYIDEDMIVEALFHQRSFNLIHLQTMIKIDVFVLSSDPFAKQAFERAQQIQVPFEAGATEMTMSSPEDIILQKLKWYVLGNQVSERQWLDVLGVLKVQAAQLDLGYMKTWATRLKLSELLEKALEESDIADS